MQTLATSERLNTEHAKMPCEVLRWLGAGGQGEVYSVRLGTDQFALKWYYANTATAEQYVSLRKLVEVGPPTDRFLWPFDMVSKPGAVEFGYLMPLYPPGYHNLNKFMKGRVRCTYRALTTAALQLAESFFQLHAKGLCYCDISFGNVFWRADSGDILVCDNDNVAVNRSGVAAVLGTLPFMAPEIVRGEAWPSRDTDLYSLAVLLFYMFLHHHPLEGRRETAIHCKNYPAQRQLYGLDPLFIFDPQDDSNRPDPDVHSAVLKLWEIFPQFLRDLFIQAFTSGVRDSAGGRVRENQWRKAFVALRDAIVYGPTGIENFYCDEYRRAHDGQMPLCWASGQRVAVPWRLELGHQLVVLNHDTKIYPHHVDPQRQWDFSAPVAEIGQHPRQPEVWGVKNLSPGRWVARTVEGQSHEVEPGRSVGLASGTTIDFGAAQGGTLRW